MDLAETERAVAKLLKVALGQCESCLTTVPISQLNDYGGLFLCPECIEKSASGSEKTVELPA